MEKAVEEVQRSLRYNDPLSLLMMDIDHFKGFNDSYGHQVGDKLLCHLVNLCHKQLRSQDVLGRYGGEEFVVLMPETDINGAVRASERLREKIEKMKIAAGGKSLSITMSMGVASFERGFDQSKTLDILVKEADTALYAAKAAGRNCIKSI